jgi:hypothetical protein
MKEEYLYLKSKILAKVTKLIINDSITIVDGIS